MLASLVLGKKLIHQKLLLSLVKKLAFLSHLFTHQRIHHKANKTPILCCLFLL
ncbi:hypothetical protein M23134_01042 [Microscilla marina ATCC 23134]|uniref:Uncharacterized protein n=1 Tax=Microscilla marina ATCC 23134 TaxID=313606 RepID=A1ZFE4_MICM2|nr:hypothetical protein M23134_01042 [Microscilla marina ATCC 23134]